MKKTFTPLYSFNLLCFLILFFAISRCTAQSSYKVLNKFSVEGDGGWDYIFEDDASARLFVSHGTAVNVVDEKTGSLLGTISGLKGVHGIAGAFELNKGFISDGRDSSVTIFDLKTLAVITKVKVTGANPDAILYDPFSHKVFTFNGRSSNATVIDAATNAVVNTIPLEGKPEFSVTDGKGKIYVNIEDKGKICVINTLTMKVEQSWSVSPGKEPSGLAIDNETHRLFSVCDNKLMVIVDALSGKIITTLPIGENVDGVSFDTGKKRAYSSNGDGTMTVVQEENADTFKVLETVNTQKGARTITLNNKTHHLFLPTAEYNPTPEKTKDNTKPRPSIKAKSFVILDLETIN